MALSRSDAISMTTAAEMLGRAHKEPWHGPARASISADLLKKAETPPAAGEKEEVVQQYVEGLAAALSKLSGRTVVLMGQPSRPAYRTRKPDIVGYLAGPNGMAVSQDEAHVVWVGELKRPRPSGSAGVFADDELAQLAGLLMDLVRAQPFRAGQLQRGASSDAVAVGFLSDGAHVILCQATFDVSLSDFGVEARLNRWRQTEPLPMSDGGLQALAALVSQPPQALGFTLLAPKLVSGRDLTLRALLGSGATSVVYEAAVGAEGRGIVKVFHGGQRQLLEAEAAALAACARVPAVVRLLEVDADSGMLVLAPICPTSYTLRDSSRLQGSVWDARFCPPGAGEGAGLCLLPVERLLRRPTLTEFCDLVDALAGMHEAGWAHRDPRPENFFRDAGGTFVLSDLGAAVRLGDAPPPLTPFAGAYGPLRALREVAAGRPLPAVEAADDWEQVARLVIATWLRLRVPSTNRSVPALLAGWEAVDAHLAGSRAACLLDLAAQKPFPAEAFKAAIRRLFGW